MAIPQQPADQCVSVDFEAASAITAGHLVKVTAAGLATVSTVAGEKCMGIAQSTVAIGDMVSVIVSGASCFIAGAALTSGTNYNLMSAGNGKSIAYVAAAANFISGCFIPNSKDPVLADLDIGTCVALPAVVGL
jgi:hypothetical protein